MKLIDLTKGKKALVDAEDFDLLMSFKWHATFGSRETKWYARRALRFEEQVDFGVRQNISMHRFIMRPPEHLVVDHLNGDSLDNRRSNLEIITQQENMRRVATWKRKGMKADMSQTEIDFK